MAIKALNFRYPKERLTAETVARSEARNQFRSILAKSRILRD